MKRWIRLFALSMAVSALTIGCGRPPKVEKPPQINDPSKTVAPAQPEQKPVNPVPSEISAPAKKPAANPEKAPTPTAATPEKPEKSEKSAVRSLFRALGKGAKKSLEDSASPAGNDPPPSE